MHSTLTKNHQSKWFVINLTGLEVGTFICNTTGNPLKCSLFSAWPRRFLLFFSFVCQFLKYKCLRHVYIVSMLNIVKKLFIYGFNLLNISKILEKNIYIMCCFTKFCMTLGKLGRFILRRIYHLRIIQRMISLGLCQRKILSTWMNAPTLQNMQNIYVPIYVEL